MKTKIERGLLAGVGLLSLTEEKAREFVDDLVERGKVRREDAEAQINRLTKRGEEERQEIKKIIHDEVSTVMGKMGLVTQKDFQELTKSIRAIQKKD
jgi:polyhydroxyalkanoate synthesis regulator phasin